MRIVVWVVVLVLKIWLKIVDVKPQDLLVQREDERGWERGWENLEEKLLAVRVRVLKTFVREMRSNLIECSRWVVESIYSPWVCRGEKRRVEKKLRKWAAEMTKMREKKETLNLKQYISPSISFWLLDLHHWWRSNGQNKGNKIDIKKEKRKKKERKRLLAYLVIPKIQLESDLTTS
jgi:hypothetical protein